VPIEAPRFSPRLEWLKRWYRPLPENGSPLPSAEEPPLRAELYSVEQLERHARALAESHRITTRRAPDRLLARLDENERVLVDTHDLITHAVKKSRRIAPAAEWLIDNFYVIEEQIRAARRHLPRSYSRELPRLTQGPAAGFPRVYGIVLELISHVDGGVTVSSLSSFIAAYQTVVPLTLGELWAVPIMLRLALLENLRRVAARLAHDRRDRDFANDWAERMAAVVEQNPSDLIIVLADMARANPPLTSAFLAELTRHLHGHSSHYAFAQSWLEHRLAEQGLRLGPLIQMESQTQAADQVSIGNSITSLRVVTSTDWREFVEEQSVVERTLRSDPAEVYEGMDFNSRDHYRHAVEEIRRRSSLSEGEIARAAVNLATEALSTGSRAAHVGYYLIDKGRESLEQAAKVRWSLSAATTGLLRRYPLLFYLIAVTALTAAGTVLWLDWAHRLHVTKWALTLLAIPVVMCAAHIGINLIHWLTTIFVGPRSLPRMDFRAGIPAECRTIVIVPTLLASAESVDELIDGLEVRYLANSDANLHFALLTDLKDAPQEVMPEDEELICRAREGIESLNEKYASLRTDIFFLFHRPRRWNAGEAAWIGQERKRGKLHDLNAFLRQGVSEPFSEIVGETDRLRNVRYVITLDTDTELPRDSASRMIGAMAHPLNRPVFDRKRRRVVDGYSILQPRVGVSLPSAGLSWFVRLFAADVGLDPYTHMVSDVYQDLFSEGSFIGKGIYDIAAFEMSCSNFTANAILSHDLLEGAHARSGLLSDIELFEDHPARYAADVSRRRRWIRGDWQIAGWLLPRVPGQDSHWSSNPIAALSRWKIFDNLRRSLVPAAMLTLLLCGWLVWPRLSSDTTLLVVATVAAAPLLSILVGLIRKPADVPWRMHLDTSILPVARQLTQILFWLTFLPYETFVSCDAIGRTLVRLLWTRRRLLEWQTSREAHIAAEADLSDTYRSMWAAPAFGAAILILAGIWQPHVAQFVPLAVLWMLSPGIAWWLSRPIPVRAPRLSDRQKIFLHTLARRTWRYFQVFVTAEENWLPPDNFQEQPAPITAMRTSPTNIGMALLANLAAYDFGYSSAAQLLDRTEKTLGTLARLERFRDHFYNWYDTRTLNPLSPRYVSTVDSGNLVGHLIVLRRGLLGLIDQPIVAPRIFNGIADTVRVLLDVQRGMSGSTETAQPSVSHHTIRQLETILQDIQNPPTKLAAISDFLQRLTNLATELAAVDAQNAEFGWWAKELQRTATDHRDDLALLAPWSGLASLPEGDAAASAPWAEKLKQLTDLLGPLEQAPTLRQVAALQLSLLPQIDAILKETSGLTSPAESWLRKLRGSIAGATRRATDRIRNLEDMAKQCHELSDIDFSFLYDESHDLFTIGYNVVDHRADAGHYDLLASEARLISFVAVAEGQVSQEHWFALSRLLTSARGNPALLSWSGSMFEYLMPLLVMPTYDNTLLDRTYKAVVRRQIDYGKQRGVPWGISESGYNATDVQMNYQYRAFGVPGLGLKRGLAEDLVIAPYASVMSLMVAPEAACRNLQRLSADGRMGIYGFYEAVDYTPSRLPRGEDSVTVRSFMAHHQGMSFLSLAYLLLDRPMQRRFESDPMLRATELLLQERVPRAAAPVFPHAMEAGTTRGGAVDDEQKMRVFSDPNGSMPAVNLISNGRYHVMVSAAGGGYSRWRDLAVTRWREDATRDCWGSFCYLRSTESKRFWSTSHQPTLQPSRNYEAIFTQARAEFRRRDGAIDTHTEISVSPEDDIELRRVTMINRSDLPQTVELTTYAEVVLAPAAQDLSHPAFSNLFVQTELVRPRHAILCTRRPRSAAEKPPWMFHLTSVQGHASGETSFETDRLKFIGRGRTSAAPQAMDRSGPLSNTEGSVLDPIVSIRRAVRLEPGETARIDIVTGIAETREGAMSLIEKYDDPRLADRVFELAWTHSYVELRQLNASEADAQLYCRLAGSLIYATSQRRANSRVLARNRRGQSGLWGYGISGDLPIVLLRIRDRARLDLVRQAVQAHAYWRMRGLQVDLVVWNEDDSVYRQNLHDAIMDIFAGTLDVGLIDKPGGLFLRRGEQISEEDRVLLQAVARVVLFDDAGTLREQVERRERSEPLLPAFRALRPRAEPFTPATVPQRDLKFFNGLGGFTHDGREYLTILAPGQNTPAPWSNVIANAQFGTVVSESGSEYTWSENSHEFRLTPWQNDPVKGGQSEGFYIRDEESGRFWSPSPHPARGSRPYIIHHGFGYTIFEYEEDGIASELIIYVATDAPVKFARFKIANRSGRPRRLSITGYWEFVLGELREKTLMHVVSEIDPITNALFARNAYNTEFAGRVVFVDSSETITGFTADRTEFLGRNGTPANPAAFRRTRLSGKVGAGLDPCAAVQVQVPLSENEEKELSFTFGAAQSDEQARQLIQQHHSANAAQRALEGVWHYWSRSLGALYVETPDPAVNFLANGWLLYQTLACRMWARTGFYQSGGAWGFRDQLQDAMALVHAEPAILREHLLRAASRQFREGDVQHWWHPPQGRGVRTHISDDYLWLPYAACRYVAATGDTGVWAERIAFLDARPVRAEEESYYDLPHVSDDIGTLYDHCMRAIKHGLRFGSHGLPLMGCGDWNDGMNLVGAQGNGESVWLGFFLYDVLNSFAAHAREQADTAFAETCVTEASELRQRIEANAWDGDWYRRAYFDNGEPLGSAQNPECQIDALPQAWAILSGAGEPGRAKLAMDHVDQRLVRRIAGLIQLFDPPFDKSNLEPGYIKGYVPGVRENGGQYTHAAVWTAMAFAAIGDSHRAWELLALVNPILHATTPGQVQVYKVEPYVQVGDVYAATDHVGRGGWTWYTGSAGWMYRLITESLLGVHLEIDKLKFKPCLPAAWESFKIHYRYRETFYHITINNHGGGVRVKQVYTDDAEQSDQAVHLIDDRNQHNVTVEIE